MRINGPIASPVMLDKETSRASRIHDASSEAAKPDDVVRISQAAQDLSTQENIAEEATRQQKITALKRAVESGTYRVEPEKVATAMISDLAHGNDPEKS